MEVRGQLHSLSRFTTGNSAPRSSTIEPIERIEQNRVSPAGHSLVTPYTNSDFRFCIRKSPPLNIILSQMNKGVHVQPIAFVSTDSLTLSCHLLLYCPSDPYPSLFPTKLLSPPFLLHAMTVLVLLYDDPNVIW